MLGMLVKHNRESLNVRDLFSTWVSHWLAILSVSALFSWNLYLLTLTINANSIYPARHKALNTCRYTGPWQRDTGHLRLDSSHFDVWILPSFLENNKDKIPPLRPLLVGQLRSFNAQIGPLTRALNPLLLQNSKPLLIVIIVSEGACNFSWKTNIRLSSQHGPFWSPAYISFQQIFTVMELCSFVTGFLEPEVWSIFKCSLDHHGSFLFPGSQVSLLLLWELLVAFHAKFLLESFYLCWGMSSSEAMLMLGEVSNSGLHWTQFLATLPAVQCRGGHHLKLEWPDYKH